MFTTETWVEGQCWLHRYSEKPKCPRAGEYGQVASKDADTRKIRWCREHATRIDVRIPVESEG